MTRALVLGVALLAGCAGHANVQLNSAGAPSGGASTGTSVYVQGNTGLGNLLAIGLLVGMSYGSDAEMARPSRVPGLDPARRVVVQDCTKPIEDRSANLKCR